MHNNNNRFIEGRNLHLDCSLLSIHTRMSRNSRFDPLSREIKPPLPSPLLSITMRKSLGEKVARTVEGRKAFEKRREIERPGIWESKIEKKKERERGTEAYGASVFSTRMRSRDFCPAASCRDGSRRMILDYFERACVSRAILAEIESDRFQTVFEASTDALPTDAFTMILWK